MHCQRFTLPLRKALKSPRVIRLMSLHLLRLTINPRNPINPWLDCFGLGGVTALSFVTEPNLPPGWTIVRMLPNVQMLWTGPRPPLTEHEIQDLNTSHANEMLALTELNKLGRFRKRRTRTRIISWDSRIGPACGYGRGRIPIPWIQ